MPAVCNNQMYQQALVEKISTYLKEQECQELALRYAENLASGRFLWRNRIGAEPVEIKVSLLEEGAIKESWSFDAQKFSLQNFGVNNDPQIKKLAEAIRLGLIGESFTFLKVEAFARLGVGQEVFPSQELVRDSGNEKYKKVRFSILLMKLRLCILKKLAMLFARLILGIQKQMILDQYLWNLMDL